MDLKKYLPYMAGLCFSTVFGFSFMFSKEGLEVIAPFHLLAFRFTLAALFLTSLWVLGIIKLDFSGKRMDLVLLLALFQPGLYFVFEIHGINQTTSSEAGLMISLIPVVVTILSAIFLKEKPTSRQLFFILLSVGGVIFITLMRGITTAERNYLGLFLLWGAVTMGGFYNILSRKLSVSFKPVEITFVMIWFGAIMFNVISYFNQGTNLQNYISPLFQIQVLIPVVYLGIFSSIVAFFMLNFTLSQLPAHQSSVFANLTTVISILAGVIFRNEPFYWFQIIGAAMIIAGVWGTNYFGNIEERKKAAKSKATIAAGKASHNTHRSCE